MNNPLEMSDDDFLKNLGTMAANASSPSSEGNTPAEETPAEEVVTPPAAAENPAPEQEELSEAEKAARAEGEEDPAPASEGDKPTEEKTETKEGDTPKPEGEAPAPVEGQAPTEEKPVNYEELYADLLKPFKANGRMVEPRNAEEARQLMQMGANYTKKMQAMQQHNKLILMLQNNGLLDEGKLDFLVALDKKDPEAIKKFIKESGVDPLDIDTTTDHAFQPGSHTVTDAQANFHAVLDELDSTPAGKETLDNIDKTWDQPSKQELGINPSIISTIHQHREAGIYDLIATEIDRRKTLGQIPANVRFIDSYKTVGDELAAAGKFDNLGKAPEEQPTPQTPAPKPEPKVVTTRAVVPPKQVNSDDKASAAAASRSAPNAVKEATNFLSMSDDDFLRQMQGRV